MGDKVKAEGEAEEALFNKFMCYCKNSGGNLDAGIAAAETKIPQLETSIKESTSHLAQLKEDLKNSKAAREEAKSAMAKATSVRDKEAAAYAEESTEYKANIDALGGAIAAV